MGADWTEALREQTGVDFLATRPEEIEKKSFEIIQSELGVDFLQTYPAGQLPVLCRVIHTTADFSYRDSLYFSDDVIARALKAVQSGVPVVTDTTMAAAGINKQAAKKHKITIHCFIGDEDVKEAARLYPQCIYAVGNAPTALMRLYELMSEGRIHPCLIIGAPVGFVNVREAKELILHSEVPAIVARGRKGGSTVAAAICNALLYMA